jgi:molecular chaperone IbpA
MTNFNTDHLRPFTVGFESVIDRLMEDSNSNRSTGFPPYNIRKNSDTEFKIDLAVAGLDIGDVDIEVIDGQLIVKSVFEDKLNSHANLGEYIHRGISFKKFTRSFTLADDIVVTSADLKNGLLTINLERIVPEEKKPKKISINGSSTAEKQYLKS